MYNGILVPVDGSTLGERALTLAIPLAEQHEARLVLIHVHEPVLPMTAGGGMPVSDPALDQSWREEQRQYLEKLAKRMRKRTTRPVETVFRDGDVVPTIERTVREMGIRLVVMCTHGRGGFQRFFLGSVADGLMRHLPVPLLLLRGARGAPTSHEGKAGQAIFERVLVPLDGSDRAELALTEVGALLGTTSSTLLLAHVVHPMVAAAAAHLARRPDLDIQTTYLEPLAARLRSTMRSVIYEARVDGNVARALKEIAEKHGADLIALTSQGLGGVQRFVVGSVADKLVRTAMQPVLICPGAA
jgi:nucleotide-binding universal stress UspA family protein